jgi:hypothetical protein
LQQTFWIIICNERLLDSRGDRRHHSDEMLLALELVLLMMTKGESDDSNDHQKVHYPTINHEIQNMQKLFRMTCEA